MTALNPSHPADAAAAAEHARRIVVESGTSFAHGMRILPPEGRRAMYAIYAFCREIDDIADEPGTESDKRAALAEWTVEIGNLYAGRPTRLTTVALAPAVAAYDLPEAEFHELIAGMLMDVDMDFGAGTRLLDHAGLRLYCRRVAGAVGLLSINVFGEPEAKDFALAMGDALQLTNILRDIGEDARIGRCYLPSDMLAAHGIPAGTPDGIARHPALPKLCMELAAEAEARFAETERLLARHDRRRLKPALLMAAVYHGLLRRMVRDGFSDPTRRISLSKLAKLGLALRALAG
ncbi:MAG: presqualene diphosphate synthase HpnD [Pseudomonadota bacterium]|nr:presqualene diphosphate synthase HpnD [Pseudomonadota bacterium]